MGRRLWNSKSKQNHDKNEDLAADNCTFVPPSLPTMREPLSASARAGKQRTQPFQKHIPNFSVKPLVFLSSVLSLPASRQLQRHGRPGSPSRRTPRALQELHHRPKAHYEENSITWAPALLQGAISAQFAVSHQGGF